MIKHISEAEMRQFGLRTDNRAEGEERRHS